MLMKMLPTNLSQGILVMVDLSRRTLPVLAGTTITIVTPIP